MRKIIFCHREMYGCNRTTELCTSFKRFSFHSLKTLAPSANFITVSTMFEAIKLKSHHSLAKPRNELSKRWNNIFFYHFSNRARRPSMHENENIPVDDGWARTCVCMYIVYIDAMTTVCPKRWAYIQNGKYTWEGIPNVFAQNFQ